MAIVIIAALTQLTDAAMPAPSPSTLAPTAPPAPFGPGDWPMYGHDLANSRNGGAAGPTPAQARLLGPVWSFRSENGGFTGTPVIGGGVLVIGSNRGVVYALDPSTGALKWQRALTFRSIYLTGSAAIADDTVFVPVQADRSPYLVALAIADGSERWRTRLDSQRGADTYSSPVVWKGTVYTGTSGTPTEQTGHTRPRVRGSVVALAAATGKIRWKRYTVPRGRDGGAVWSTPAIDTRRARLYVGTGNAYSAPAADTTDAILMLDARTGRIRAHHTTYRNDVFTDKRPTGPDYDFGASPNLINDPKGRPLVGELAKSGVYWAVDRRHLRRRWRRATGTSRTSDALSSTAYDGARVYGMTDRGQLWALRPSGGRVWVLRTNGSANFSPVGIANGVLYAVRSRGALEARDARTGTLLSALPLGARSWGGIAVAGGYVFTATGTDESSDGYIVGFRPRAPG